MARLRDKVAIVTGAGNGLGRAHALALAAEGAKVLVNDVGRPLADEHGGRGLASTAPDPAVAEQVAEAIARAGGVAVADAADVASVDGAAGVVEAALRAFGDVDIVVNNAGTLHAAEVDDIDDARLDADFSVNVKGTAGTTMAAFAAMRQRGHGGSIVNTMTGFGGYPAGHGLVAYNAAKHAVASYTLSAAAAGAEHRIRVNAFCPTAVTRQSGGWFFDEGLIDAGDEATLAHLAPERMSPLVVFLASEAARELTGRLFMFVPTSLGADAQFQIKEVFAAETEGVCADSWTADELERAAGSFLRTSDRQGDWSATLAGPAAIPAPRA
jgi:NAD(P)-dependent dehydrogenase (short-subunit alcohol dehydrogenase family)